MGLLRLLLAISVVVLHCDANLGLRFLVGGSLAVRLFFVISGFYMALILHEKYTAPRSAGLFYGNRLLRLLPTYYLVLALAGLALLTASLARGHVVSLCSLGAWHTYGALLPERLAAALKWVQVTPLGQELPSLGLLDETGRQGVSTVPTGPAMLPLQDFMLLPPAWSLSLELQFYLLAPWLVRRSPAWLTGVLAGSLLCRWLLPMLPFGTEEFWQARVLPTQLGYFMLGVLGYRVYRARESSRWWPRLVRHGISIWVGVVALLFLHPWLPAVGREAFVIAGFAVALPFVFATTAAWNWDRWLGELSYPLYLCHWPVKEFWYGLDLKRAASVLRYGWESPVLILLLSLLVAAAIHLGLERPVDRFRQRRARARLEGSPSRLTQAAP